MTFDLKTWQGFDKLSRREPDFGLDTAAVNRRLAQHRDNPKRWHFGVFNVPDGVSRWQFDKLVQRAADRWIGSMARDGWTLTSKPELLGPYMATDGMTNVPLLGHKRYKLRAIFATEPKPLRIEVPAGLVKQSPDHTLTLQEALAADPMPDFAKVA